MNVRMMTAGMIIAGAMASPGWAHLVDFDGGTLTCQEFLAGNAADKNVAMGAVRVFIKESANHEAAGAAALAADLEDEELMGRLDQGCVGAPETLTLVEALKR
jgi:hypothetical protein